MSSHARTDASLVPQRTTALIAIIGLHVALIFAFATGLGPKVAAVLPSAIQAKFLTPDEPREAPPPPPQPTFKTAPVAIPEPEWPVIQTGTDAIVNTVPHDRTDLVPPGPPSPPEPKAVQRVQGGPGKGFPNTADYYPPSSIRLGETGTATVNVCVDAKGRLAGTPTLAKSSGSARLDEGAVKLARAGSGHYRATTENGQPVDSCYPLGITFQLRD